MANKNIYKVLDTVYKTLRMPNEKDAPVAKNLNICSEKFSHKPFVDILGMKASLLQKKRIHKLKSERKSCCILPIQKPSRISFPPKLLPTKPNDLEQLGFQMQNALDHKEQKIISKCEQIRNEIQTSLNEKKPVKIDYGLLIEDMKSPQIKSPPLTARSHRNHLVIKSQDFRLTPTSARSLNKKKSL